MHNSLTATRVGREKEREGADWLIERKAAAAASDRKEPQKLE